MSCSFDSTLQQRMYHALRTLLFPSMVYPLRYLINHFQATQAVPHLSYVALLTSIALVFVKKLSCTWDTPIPFDYLSRYLLNHFQATQAMPHLSHAVLLIRHSSVFSQFSSQFRLAAVQFSSGSGPS